MTQKEVKEEMWETLKDHDKRIRFLERWIAAAGGVIGAFSAFLTIARAVGLHFALALLVAPALLAQSERQSCTHTYKLAGNSQTRVFDNSKVGCAYWTLTYSAAAPVTVQTSADASTWETALTVTAGTMPTPSGTTVKAYGKVSLSGYAPYLKIITGTATMSGNSEGTLYGSIGLAAAGISSSAPPMYTAIVPAEWTSLDTPNFTRTNLSGSFLIDTIPGNVGGTQQFFVCKTVSGANGIYRLTYRTAGMVYSGTNEIGLSLLNASNRENVTHLARASSNTQINYGFRCASGQSTCSVLLSDDHHQLLGSAEIKTLIVISTATHWGFTGYDPVLGRTLAIRPNDDSIATQASAPVTGGFNRACVWIASTNGNYAQHHQILGFDFTPL